MTQRLFFFLSVTVVLLLSGCASSKMKARQEQREKLAASSGMYCQFVSGDLFPDLDVELNMQMAKRCDSNKNFSITNYRTSSDQNGVIYCCSAQNKSEKKAAPMSSPKGPSSGGKPDSQSDKDSDIISE